MGIDAKIQTDTTSLNIEEKIHQMGTITKSFYDLPFGC
jgi:hypothetical protein